MLFLLLALLGTLLLHGLILGRLAVLYHLFESHKPVDVLWLGPSGGTSLTALLAPFAAAPVLVLASILLPFLGLPAIAGAALALALTLPFALLDDRTTYFYEWWLGSIRPLLLVAGLGAFVLGTWAWFRPVRAGQSRARLLVGVATAWLVVGGLGLGAALAARGRYESFETLDAADIQLRLEAIGGGGRFAYVNAYRGDPSPQFTLDYPAGVGSMPRPFVIDLTTGASRHLPGAYLQPARRGGRVDAPLVLLTGSALQGPGGVWTVERTWLEAASGVTLGRDLASRIELPPDVLAFEARSLEEQEALPLPNGERAWLGIDALLHRGSGGEARSLPLDLVPRLREATAIRAIPGGWALRWGGQSGGWLPSVYGGMASVEAATGGVRYLTADRIQPRHLQVLGWLSTREVLLVPAFVPGVVTDPRAWRVLDLDTGSSRPALGGGDAPSKPLQPIAVLDETQVLALDTTESGRPVIVDLTQGTTHSVRWDAVSPGRVHSGWAPEAQAMPTSGGGSVLVDMFLLPPGVELPPGKVPGPGAQVSHGAWTGPSVRDVREPVRPAFAVVSAKDGSAWWFEPQGRWRLPELLGLDREGRVWMLENAREIVRYGPGTGVRQVMFPRAP